MLKRSNIIASMAIALSTTGCTTTGQYAETEVPVAQLREKVVTGSASYRERIALFPGSTFTVQLLDVSHADAASSVVAEEVRKIDGDQVPLTFSLNVMEQELKTNMRYAVRATITDPTGNLVWTTDTVHSVDPRSFEQDLGILNMVHVERDAQDSGLVGTQFNVEDVNGAGPIDGSSVTVLFAQDGRVAGSAGCNRFAGDYMIDGRSLEIGTLAVTRRACVPALDNQEANFLGVLQDLTSWDAESSGRLVLRTDDSRYLYAIRF